MCSYQIDRCDSFRRDLAGAIKPQHRFDGAGMAAVSTTLLVARLADDHANRRRGLSAFDRAIDHYHRKRIHSHHS